MSTEIGRVVAASARQLPQRNPADFEREGRLWLEIATGRTFKRVPDVRRARGRVAGRTVVAPVEGDQARVRY